MFGAPGPCLGELPALDRLLLCAAFLVLVATAARAGIIASGLGHMLSTFAPRRTHPMYRDLMADARMRQLTALIGVDRRTVARRRAWWRDSFTASRFLRIALPAVLPPADQDRLPDRA